MNSELSNLLEMFSNFYQAIIINEPDKEKLQSSLYGFRNTFEPNDFNFSKTKFFLNQMSQGIVYNPNQSTQNQEYTKFQPTLIKKNQDFESYHTQDYINYYHEIMEEMSNVEEKYRIKDVLVS